MVHEPDWSGHGYPDRARHGGARDPSVEPLFSGFGLPRSLRFPALEIAPGRCEEITVGESGVLPGWNGTANTLREFGEWFGTPVEDAVPRPTLRRPVPVPWIGGVPTQDVLEQAAFHYLFGDPDAVATYEGLLDAVLAPFSLCVYPVGELRIGAGATLRFRGGPVVVLAERVVVERGGCLAFAGLANLRAAHWSGEGEVRFATASGGLP